MGDRIGVLYSREDISGGMVGEPMDGILGYEPAAATKIMQEFVLYGERGGKAPATAPVAAAPDKNAKTAKSNK